MLLIEEKQCLGLIDEDDRTLGSYDIERRSPLKLTQISHIQIFVKTLSGRTDTYSVPRDATLGSLHKEVEAFEGIPIGMTYFSWF